MLITGHTPNYSHTMVRTAGKGEGGGGEGARFSIFFKQNPAETFSKSSKAKVCLIRMSQGRSEKQQNLRV